jgi:hypothetical protein
MPRIRIVAAIAGTIALLVSLSGTAAAADPTGVRLWNVIATEQTVDLLFDGSVLFHDVAYGTVTDRVAIDPGTHSYELRDSSTHGAIGGNKVRFPAGSATTVVLFHPAGGQNDWQDELKTINDAALVRVFAITQKTVTTNSAIDVVESGETLGTINYYTIPSDYIELTPGTHHLQLVNRNTGNAFFHFSVTVKAGTNYTAFIWDDNGTTRANLVVDAESVSDSAVGVTANVDRANGLLGLGILLTGFASWLALSTAWRRMRAEVNWIGG